MRFSEVSESVQLAWKSMSANKMRSLLTVLGVLIGVSALIGMVAIIQGLNKSMSEQIESLGSNAIFVSRFKPGIQINGSGRSEEERNRKRLTVEDAMAIKELCPSVKAVSPSKDWWQYPEGNVARYRGNEAKRPEYSGVVPDYSIVYSLNLSHGRFFNDTDMQFKTYSAVLGADVADALFPREDPLGKVITLNTGKFAVIGVAEKRKSLLGQSMDNYVLIPLSTYEKIHPGDEGVWIGVQPKSKELISQAIDEMTELLRRRRGVAYDKPEDFAVFTQEALMELYHKITDAVYLVMIVISSIALLVGGVGVMNIMLVSVTERTREIGIRKAIGARRKDILRQFLLEAVAMTGTGGVLGILTGFLIAMIVNATTPLAATVSGLSIAIGFSFSVGVGLFFGIYPATRAARLDPIEALRYE
ncbi:MAG: hypothetical protein CO189_12290 [candidate division Zixibacteria bacterium CG_4_9_14_3_um_filter_46_8]|nr:MAG: hypothetical protein CO189_12290 [candidate division Zixibacteria bacterium CG_4_9_14_3_um_filter_46_8]